MLLIDIVSSAGGAVPLSWPRISFVKGDGPFGPAGDYSAEAGVLQVL
ncbi:hypothetical protein [Variovorax sp. SRS16]|nr:hypothetical protein [Variovorax sp. SRS16]